ncbi:MAG: RNB domain-containing ribonuclease, partial [Coriobacteriales bacterium]|nr:RNB domain-containing ribonuclease [Coriobacteriales bacterium]
MAHSQNKTRRKPRQFGIGRIRVTYHGYAFVSTSEGDFFVTRGRLNGAMNGDLVEVHRLRSVEQRQYANNKHNQNNSCGEAPGRRREHLGAVKRILERSHQSLIGVLSERDGLRVVRPVDRRIQYDIFIDSRKPSIQADDGDLVSVCLTVWPSRLEAAVGYIEEVLGAADQPGMDVETIIRSYDIRNEFPAAVLEEAEAATLLGAESDLRDMLVFTIDPEDARDFDDALSVDYIDGRLWLGVHIADVSAYVPPGSALDAEAFRRATSVYLPDRVIPMLPSKLSDDICSLKPGVDRKACSVMMQMGSDGHVNEVHFHESLIRSRF